MEQRSGVGGDGDGGERGTGSHGGGSSAERGAAEWGVASGGELRWRSVLVVVELRMRRRASLLARATGEDIIGDGAWIVAVPGRVGQDGNFLARVAAVWRWV